MAYKQTSLNDLPRNPNYDSLQSYQLGIDPYVKGLVNFLKGTVTPMTVALQGEWGSGKTSLMYKLQAELCGEANSPYESVWINTWTYSLMSNPTQALLSIVAKMVSATESNNLIVSKARNVLGQIAKGVAKTAIGQITNDTSIVDAISDIFTNGGGDSCISQLQTELRKNIEFRCQNSNKRGIIFFIDDLDRLNPTIAVELLELLQNIFTLDGCIFVLAIDYDVVVKGLKSKFGELTNQNEREFRSFFDKIIQVPFAMPVSNYKPYEFIVSALEAINYIGAIDSKDNKFMGDIMNATKLTVGNNPRSIKRLMNILSLISCISSATAARDQKIFGLESRLGKYVNYVVLAIQVQYPKIFRMLSLNPDFKTWDSRIVKKMNVTAISAEKSQELKDFEESDETWEQALYAVCDSDSYLHSKFVDISNLLNILKSKIELGLRQNKPTDILIEDYYTLGDVMRESIQITSVTNFASDDSNPVSIDGEEWTQMVYKFHDLMSNEFKDTHPDWRFKQRRNTGNGGFNFTAPIKIEIPFSRQTIENTPAMSFNMNRTYFSDGALDHRVELLKEVEIENAMNDLDGFMGIILKNNDWIEWESIVDHHREDSNFKMNELIHFPSVIFKFKDIERFTDLENIRTMAKVISKFIDFGVIIDNFFYNDESY